MALIGKVNMNAQHARFPVTQGNECYARPWEIYSRRLATAPAPILGGRNYTKVYKERLKTNACPWPCTLTFPPRTTSTHFTFKSTTIGSLSISMRSCGTLSLLSWARLQWLG